MIAAVTMVRDEADIIEQVVRQLFDQGVDRMWVADNLSRDATRGILEDLARAYPLTVVDDPEQGYYQSQKMTRLAQTAGEAGATWVLPFDADEWWYGIGDPIGQVLRACEADVVKAYGFDHLPRDTDSDLELDPVRRLGWRRPVTQTFPKVAFRAHPAAVLHMGNHNVEHPGGRVETGLLEYRHFGYRSLSQMARKVRNGKQAYEASTVHEMHGAHWRHLGGLSDTDLAAEWQRLLDEDGLIYDPAPAGPAAHAMSRGWDVSVVVPHYGSASLTAACLLALATHTQGVEVIVVDNGTGDSFPADIVIHNNRNEGFARACNQGAAAASHDRVVFLNNDCEVRAGWLPPLLNAMHGQVAAVGSQLLYPDGRVQHAGVTVENEPGGLVARNRRVGAAGPVAAVTGACMLVDKARYWAAGGMDEGYWNGYEDVDLCLTLRDMGWQVIYEPASVVMHRESQSGPERWSRVRENVDRLQRKWAGVMACG